MYIMAATHRPLDERSPRLHDAVLNTTSYVELQQLLPTVEGVAAEGNGLETIASGPLQSSAIARAVSWWLYISHFLSTWSSRVFEFGAVLFLAKIFPGTLVPVSMYAVVRSASAIVLSPKVGSYIDVNGRLKVVRISIGTSNKMSSYEATKF